MSGNRSANRSIMAGILVAVLGLGLLTAAAVPFLRHRFASPVPVSAVGVGVEAAGCDPELTDPVSGKGIHVAQGSRVRYETVPPTSGPHYELPAPLRRFYTTGDRPPVEVLVHNLEHGYTIVWYMGSLEAQQIEALRRLADRTEKFVAAPWDESYGRFPAGKRIGITRWGAAAGYRLLCASVSGEVIGRFMAAHPAEDSPEPDGA
jgi:hypothetical protein